MHGGDRRNEGNSVGGISSKWKQNGEMQRSEVESAVIKIHPTLQTKRGMKKGGECRRGKVLESVWCWVGGGFGG